MSHFLWLLQAQPEGGILEKRRVCYEETCQRAGWAFSYLSLWNGRARITQSFNNTCFLQRPPPVTMFILSTLCTVPDWPTHLPEGWKYLENTGSGAGSLHTDTIGAWWLTGTTFIWICTSFYRIIWDIVNLDISKLERLCQSLIHTFSAQLMPF